MNLLNKFWITSEMIEEGRVSKSVTRTQTYTFEYRTTKILEHNVYLILNQKYRRIFSNFNNVKFVRSIYTNFSYHSKTIQEYNEIRNQNTVSSMEFKMNCLFNVVFDIEDIKEYVKDAPWVQERRQSVGTWIFPVEIVSTDTSDIAKLKLMM